jgi:hypothetical protein
MRDVPAHVSLNLPTVLCHKYTPPCTLYSQINGPTNPQLLSELPYVRKTVRANVFTSLAQPQFKTIVFSRTEAKLDMHKDRNKWKGWEIICQ